MEEKRITEKESLEIITEMISKTRDRYLGDGSILLMWGYLTVAVTVAVWILLDATHDDMWNWLWLLIPIVGSISTPVMVRRQQSRCGVKNYSDKVISKIWSVVGFSTVVPIMFCLAFQLIYNIDAWSMMLAYVLILVPFAEIAQGIILKERILMSGGAMGLLTGIFTLCCIAGWVDLGAHWFLPLFMAAFFAMMIIPGHMLNLRARRQ